MNRLTVNAGKSKCMVLCNAHDRKTELLRQDIIISVNKQQLELVNEYKYLRVILDDTLNLKSHAKVFISFNRT